MQLLHGPLFFLSGEEAPYRHGNKIRIDSYPQPDPDAIQVNWRNLMFVDGMVQALGSNKQRLGNAPTGERKFKSLPSRSLWGSVLWALSTHCSKQLLSKAGKAVSNILLTLIINHIPRQSKTHATKFFSITLSPLLRKSGATLRECRKGKSWGIWGNKQGGVSERALLEQSPPAKLEKTSSGLSSTVCASPVLQKIKIDITEN